MNFTGKMILNIYSIVILLIILINSRDKSKNEIITFKIYIGIIYISILISIVDITSRLHGNHSLILTKIFIISNVLLFSLNLIVPSLWLLYVHNHIYTDRNRNKKLWYVLLGLNLINILVVIIARPFGWLYFIDSNNIYSRGPFYAIPIIITIVLIIASFILVIRNKAKIDENHYKALKYFSVPPIIGILLQTMFFNVSVALNSLVLSILLVFLNVQRTSLNTDFLTGVGNRSTFEASLENKIDKSTKEKTFSGIMIDLNDFKSINDKFGHNVGDIALKNSARIIDNSIRSNDLLARFGGDEFCVILDIYEQNKLDAIISRINHSVDLYNATSGMPYKLKFSMGYAIYDYDSKMNAEQFKKYLDNLMYENKEYHKSVENNYSSLKE